MSEKMTEASQGRKALLARFSITQTIHIQLTRLKVGTNSNKEDGTHKCRLCKDPAKIKADSTRRLGSHKGKKPFLCTLYSYTSSSRIHLNDHISTHTGEKHYKCAFCRKAFKTKTAKLRHEKTCKLNPRQSDPSWVEMQKPIKCQVCPYSAADKSRLTRHMMTHTGEKPFTCTLCNEAFSLRANLRDHIFTHTREKPHICQFCTRGFALAAYQKKHEIICKLNPKQGDAKWVEERKKFKCQLCKYRTLTKASLERHLMSHTGEKPYKCPQCLYKRSDTSRIHRHLRRKHLQESGHKCSECDFATLSTSKLLNHAKEFHLKRRTNK